jgi:hypothetical protein
VLQAFSKTYNHEGQAQVISYLKLSGKSIGLPIDFNVVHLKDGIKRFVNGDGWKEVKGFNHEGHQGSRKEASRLGAQMLLHLLEKLAV